MKRTVNALGICLFVFAIAYGQSGGPVAVGDLGWLSGSWEYRSEKSGTTVTEYWTKPAGMMLGIARTIKSGKVTEFENLRIVEDGDTVTYIARPSSASTETPFRLTSLADGEAVFENPTHDFPKKLVYRKLSETEILVQVLGDGGKGFSYKLTRVREDD